MQNNALQSDLKNILSVKDDVSITKDSIGGASISIFNVKTNQDLGSYVYKKLENRDSDFEELQNILNNEG
jgi:hypothetical protein